MRKRPSCLPFLVLGIALAVVSGNPALAQDVSAADARRAPVVIDGETLFLVRGVTSQPAEIRAGQIAERILGLARNPAFDPKNIILEERPNATLVMANGQRIMFVLDEDAVMEEAARVLLAEADRTRIVTAIEAYRQDRRPQTLWRHAMYALSLTGALIVAAWVGHRLTRHLRAAAERRYREHLQTLEHRALHMVRAEQIWRALAGMLNLGWGVSIAVMIYAYLSHTLALFPWTRGFALGLYEMAMDPLRTIGAGFIATIPNLVFLAVLIVVVRYVLKAIKIAFDGLADGSLQMSGFDPEWASPTYRLIRMLVIVFACVVAYPYIPGSESGAFKGISLFMGVVFSLGSSSLIGNFIAGYSMTYRRTFRVGDRVKIGDQIGDVEQVRLLVTRLRTVKNEEVVVPNSAILGAQVVNYSAMAQDRGLILHTTVGIGYETPWRQVEAILLEAAARTPGLSRERTPFVLPTALGDFCVTYELNVFCEQPGTFELTYGELHKHILDVFAECGVQIMTPAYEADPKEPKVPPEGEWRRPVARNGRILEPATETARS